MKVALRTTATTIMVVAATLPEAVRLAAQEVDGDILEVNAKPFGGPEQMKLTVDFIRETGAHVPGGWMIDGGYEEEARLWQVMISAQLSVEWQQRPKVPSQLEVPLNELPQDTAAGAEVGGEPLGGVEETTSGEGNGNDPVLHG